MITKKQARAIGLTILTLLLISILYFQTINKESSSRKDELTATEQNTSNNTLVETLSTEISTTSEVVLEASKNTEVAQIDIDVPKISTKTTLPEPEKTETQASSTTKAVPVAKKISPTLPEAFSSKDMLLVHNQVRLSHNLSPLIWSETLVASAKSWADTLASQDCTMKHQSGIAYGENLYWSWSSNGNGLNPIDSPAVVVQGWASEETDYSYETNTCKPNKQCGHYTQLVWESTTAVGCAVRTCQNKSEQTDIWVCRYNPPGNYVGEKPY